MGEEKRLIDANAFLKDVLTAGIGKTIIEYSESDIGYMIRKRPTIDAVPVVRCEKCVLHGNCTTEDAFVFAGIDNPFCCSGKWKEGVDNG